MLVPSGSKQGEVNNFEETNISEADALALSSRVSQDPLTDRRGQDHDDRSYYQRAKGEREPR